MLSFILSIFDDVDVVVVFGTLKQKNTHKREKETKATIVIREQHKNNNKS